MTTEKAIFHEGELAIQRRLGVDEKMDKFGRMVIRDHMPKQHQDFYQQLPMIFAGYADPQGQVWASVLTGAYGFISTPDPKRLSLETQLVDGDPLQRLIDHIGNHDKEHENRQTRLGLLGIDLSNRRRNRLSAQISNIENGELNLEVVQSFGNCPQYIQTRDLVYSAPNEQPSNSRQPITFNTFDASMTSFIEKSDTFFVASNSRSDQSELDDTAGADVSHRGGRPGFVRVEDGHTLTIPDYTGNNHFNTLGNIEVNPNVGLLFIDFENGDIHSMTGTAKVLWDDPDTNEFKGAERLWQFKLDHGFTFPQAMPWRFKFNDWSPNSLMTDTWIDLSHRKELEEASNRWHPAVVHQVVEESAHIKSFYLSLEGDIKPSFEAGQFVAVKVMIEGQEHIRTYSVSSAPLDNFMRISVKKDGVVSAWLHQRLKSGSQLKIKLPAGAFTLDEGSDLPSIFISAGAGITPMVSMLRQSIKESLRARTSKPALMINTFRHSQDQAFFEEINDMVKGSDARVLWLLTQPNDSDTLGESYSAKGRLNKDMLQQLLPIGRYNFYLCGPDQFMQDTYDLLIELGVSDELIKAEAFGPASLKRAVSSETELLTNTEPAPADNAVIEFADSQVEQAWSNVDGNLLEFAEGHGLSPEFGCRSGSCGTCKVKVLEGAVTHGGKASFPLEHDEALLCCAMPAKVDQEIPRLILKA